MTALLRSEKGELRTAEPAPNFDRLAGIYQWVEALSFGPWLWRCRWAFPGEMRDRKRALVLGDGDGRFTARLLHENPVVEIDALDGSPAMLTALVRRAGVNRHRVRTQVADLRSWSPQLSARPGGRDYDLVVTHFFLDCLTMSEVRPWRRGSGRCWWTMRCGWFPSLRCRLVGSDDWWLGRWLTSFIARSVG